MDEWPFYLFAGFCLTCLTLALGVPMVRLFFAIG